MSMFSHLAALIAVAALAVQPVCCLEHDQDADRISLQQPCHQPINAAPHQPGPDNDDGCSLCQCALSAAQANHWGVLLSPVFDLLDHAALQTDPVPFVLSILARPVPRPPDLTTPVSLKQRLLI